jgi:predicted GIY-YIG superfamily endonuclease
MRHYLGFTHDLENRLENHRKGTACVTMKRAFDRGLLVVVSGGSCEAVSSLPDG